MSGPTIFRALNHGGPRAKTLGVVIHNTAGGKEPGYELVATANWFLSAASGVSAHRVIGQHGEHWRFVPDDLQAWHARELNATHLAIELEQGAANGTYTDVQYEIAAAVVREWAAKYGFPIDRTAIVGHQETEPGIRERKADPGNRFDWDRFMNLILNPPVEVDDSAREHAPLTGTWKEAYSNVLGVANELRDRIARFKAENSDVRI